jgi:hypothetical protein
MMSGNKRPVEIEDLLRLKRAERPPAEFWNEFDRALRAKQLAALVGRRPWWQTLPRVLASWRRASVPIGATTVAAITFYSLHHHGSSPTNPEGARDAVVAHSTTSVARFEPASVLANVEPTTKREISAASPNVAQDVTAASRAVAPNSALLVTSEKTADGTSRFSNEAQLSSALATIPAPAVRASLPLSQSFEVTRVVAKGGPIEPLQQMAPPSERTRANKILTALIAANAEAIPSRSLERTTNRLSEEQLYDQVHRFGAYGDNRGIGGSMKF